MKILFYINSIHHGGAERTIVNLAEHFSDAGYECVLVTSFVGRWEYDVPDNVTRISLFDNYISDSFIKRNILLMKSLRRTIIEEQPDVVISFMGEPNVRNILSNIGTKAKTIVSVRSDPGAEYAGIRGHMMRWFVLPFANGCVFQTADAQGWFPRRLRKRSVIIFNLVAEEFFSQKRKTPKDIVSIGRLDPVKNHILLMDAFLQIADLFPDEKLLIYGDGDYKDTLMNYIKTNHCEDRIILCGSTKDVPSVLSGAKLYVLSSDYEGMPNSLMEALAVGVPCVSTDCPCGGPRSLINDGINGYLVPCNNASELANRMKNILQDPSIAKKIGDNARMHSKEFMPEKVFRDWETYVKQIVT